MVFSFPDSNGRHSTPPVTPLASLYFHARWIGLVPWTRLVALVAPQSPSPDKAKGGRLPIALECMLRIHFMQQWFGLSDPAIKEPSHDVPLYRQFTGVALGKDCLPDESSILRFRHRLQEHKLAEQIWPA